MISIVMATYNGEKYLQQQLDSIAAQTVLPNELIVGDDCSTDNTIKILENFKNKVGFTVKIYRNKANVGYIKNFARVILEANGDYVFLCDQDDYWFSNKIETVINFFKDNPGMQIIAHNAMCTDSNLVSLGKTLFEYDISRGLEYGSAMHGFVTCVRKDFLKYATPIPYSYSFDGWLYYLSSEMKVRYVLDEVLGYYRRHDKAVTFDTIGKNQSFIEATKKRILKNIKNIKFIHSMESINAHFAPKAATLEFVRKIKVNKELPDWVDVELLNKLECSSQKEVELFKARYKAMSVNGLARLRRILSAYKKGVYNNFHGFRTAFDDLFRC